MPSIRLNIDLGELPEEPEALYACTNIANVACGGHAGDDASMRRAAALCAQYGVSLGAHPSYPDRAGFGRRRIPMAPGEIRATVAEQCSRLLAVARERRLPISFVKPHGALYHVAREDPLTAEALVEATLAALGPHVTIIGPPAGALREKAVAAGAAYAREGFADRATREDGTLVPRDEPGAIVLDPAAAATRAHALATRGDVETICVHGDTPGAVDIARAVRAALDALGEAP